MLGSQQSIKFSTSFFRQTTTSINLESPSPPQFTSSYREAFFFEIKSHSISTTTPLPSLCGEMGFYLDISGNQDVTVKLKSRLVFYRFLMFLMSLVDSVSKGCIEKTKTT